MSSEHPALKGFSDTFETIKHVGGKMLGGAAKGGMWAAIGGAVLAGIAFVATLPVSGPLAAIAAVAAPIMVATGVGSGLVTGAIGGIAAVGAMVVGVGAAVGAALGGMKGISSASEAVDEKKQQAIENYERNEMRQERKEAMDMRRMAMMQQGRARGMGVSPNALPNQQMGVGHQMA